MRVYICVNYQNGPRIESTAFLRCLPVVEVFEVYDVSLSENKIENMIKYFQ